MSDGEGEYGGEESCRVVALRPLVVSTAQYEVEVGFDFLTVGGTEFKGDSGPQEVNLDTGAEVVWSSDGSVFGEGWKVCASSVDVQTTTHMTHMTHTW